MKRKHIILLVVQSILILILLAFSFIQKTEADKSRQMAEEQYMKALEMQKRMVEMESKYKELLEENPR